MIDAALLKNTIYQKSNSVCIMGNLTIDLIIRHVPNIPKWGQEVMGKSYDKVSAGQAANIGFALSKFGIPTSIISVVGDDQEGKSILYDLKNNGINIRGCKKLKNEKTAITVAIVREDGERAFVSDTASSKKLTKKIVLNNWNEILSSSYFMIAGLFCLPGLSVKDVIFLTRKIKLEKKITMLDTGWDAGNWQLDTINNIKELLKNIDIFLPNLKEATAITGKKQPEAAAIKLREYGAKTVVIKMGPEGCLASFDNKILNTPASPAKILDTVGAGDVFDAGFIYGYSKGYSIETCIAFGNSTSALYISRLENRFPILEEVYQLVKSNYNLLRNSNK